MESPRGICKYCKEQMPRRERVARHGPNPARAQVHATGGPADRWFNSVYNMYFAGICPLGFFHFQGAGVEGWGGKGGKSRERPIPRTHPPLVLQPPHRSEPHSPAQKHTADEQVTATAR